MSKRCLVKGCDKDAAFSCECTGKPIFMCTVHPSVHLLVKGNHQITGLLFRPNKNDIIDIMQNFNFASSKIKSLIDQTLKSTEKIIKKTLQASKKLIRYLENVEFRFQNLFKKSLAYDEINIEDFELLKTIAHEDVKNKFESQENIIEQLKRIYDIDLSANSSFLVFHGNQINTLQVLDLKTESILNLSLNLVRNFPANNSLNLSPTIHQNNACFLNPYSTICYTENDTCCLCCNNSIYIIDLKENKCNILATQVLNIFIIGSVFKEDVVYFFLPNSNSCSYALDLKKKSISTISSILPVQKMQSLGRFSVDPFHNNYPNIQISNIPQVNGSACLIKNEIVLTGMSIDGLYNYNNKQNTYNKVTSLEGNLYKYIFKDWLIVNEGKLYENSGKSLSDFKCYFNNLTVNFPLISSYRVFRGFIYFIDGQLKLLRINPALKKLEIISYVKSDKNIQIDNISHDNIQQENNYGMNKGIFYN
ncbi:hypothetical protein SteCoe_32687 [Stentor coeruleus]|uniref:Uncharacterized protein n=1 Tax=Stentor coeruleus TaxID=5963 RepID=A0A1R2AYF0_9CILI|nr:hypothetical protein SteCoe_36881 [Stentor coeruleus]OMJ69549.1 hypothetical protein SteCoe_32687 [Stentor coeruleus]